jgi:co-chaperonin GroES (HSP10)
MKFRPLHDRVVVKRIEADEKSAGGIHHSGDRQRKAVRG